MSLETKEQPNKLRQGFVSLTESLLRSVAEVFPECEATEAALTLFCTFLKGDPKREDQLIRRCAKVFQEKSQSLKQREEAALFEVVDSLGFLGELNFQSKWSDPGFTEDSKANFWQYLQSLKTYAELYCALPTTVMGKLEKVAGGISERIRSGDLNLNSLTSQN